jgi:hypothetical protein
MKQCVNLPYLRGYKVRGIGDHERYDGHGKTVFLPERKAVCGSQPRQRTKGAKV